MDYRGYTIALLQKLGIQKMYKGCEYIISSICYIQKNETYFTPVTKVLYVEIAKEHNTSSLCVEKNMRSVIKTIWDKEDNKELLPQIFGEYNLSKRPSNMEFLVLLFNHIKYKMDYINTLSAHKDMYSFTCPLSGNNCEFCKEFVIDTIHQLTNPDKQQKAK